MIQGNASLIVDFGNSSTKCTVLFGRSAKTGLIKERSFELSNEFAVIEPNYVVSPDYDEKTSCILTMHSKVDTTPIVGDFCNGELQRKEKPSSSLRPSATRKKWSLPSTILSFNLALYKASLAVLAMSGTSDISQLGIQWDVVALLPPGDMEVGAKPMEDLLKSVTEVNVKYPKVSFPVKIRNVSILPEGFCAYTACVYTKQLKFRPENQHLTGETVLVLDIGAGTTDYVVIEDNKIVRSSMYSITQGGNNVFQAVRKSLRLRGIDVKDDAIRKAITEGFVKDGAKAVNIVDLINKGKEDVAQVIKAEFLNFLEETGVKTRSIGYILVSGGGAITDSHVEGVKPISESIIENFKTLAPNCECVQIPTDYICFTDMYGNKIECEEQLSLRWLNLFGASILASSSIK